jgi:hypothetical protein
LICRLEVDRSSDSAGIVGFGRLGKVIKMTADPFRHALLPVVGILKHGTPATLEVNRACGRFPGQADFRF